MQRKDLPFLLILWPLDRLVALPRALASWVQAGVEYFDGAKYQLDEFHLKKRLCEALGHDEEGYEAVAEGIMSKDLDAVKKSLVEAERRSTVSLGAIEGQVYHWIARRMKRVGARWSPEGADRMERLLAAKANNELNRYADRPAKKVRTRLAPLIDRTKEHISEDLVNHAEDIGAWLRVRVPALQGPYQSTPFVKYMLRKLVYLSSANT